MMSSSSDLPSPAWASALTVNALFASLTAARQELQQLEAEREAGPDLRLEARSLAAQLEASAAEVAALRASLASAEDERDVARAEVVAAAAVREGDAAALEERGEELRRSEEEVEELEEENDTLAAANEGFRNALLVIMMRNAVRKQERGVRMGRAFAAWKTTAGWLAGVRPLGEADVQLRVLKREAGRVERYVCTMDTQRQRRLAAAALHGWRVAAREGRRRRALMARVHHRWVNHRASTSMNSWVAYVAMRKSSREALRRVAERAFLRRLRGGFRSLVGAHYERVRGELVAALQASHALARRFEADNSKLLRFKGSAQGLLQRRCARRWLGAVLAAWRGAAAQLATGHRLVAKFQDRHRRATESRFFRAWRHARHTNMALRTLTNDHQAMWDGQTLRITFLGWCRFATDAKRHGRCLESLRTRGARRLLSRHLDGWHVYTRRQNAWKRRLRSAVTRWTRAGQQRGFAQWRLHVHQHNRRSMSASRRRLARAIQQPAFEAWVRFRAAAARTRNIFVVMARRRRRRMCRSVLAALHELAGAQVRTRRLMRGAVGRFSRGSASLAMQRLRWWVAHCRAQEHDAAVDALRRKLGEMESSVRRDAEVHAETKAIKVVTLSQQDDLRVRFARAMGNKVERGMLRLIVQQWRAVAHGAVVKRRRGGGFDARRMARLLARVLHAWRALVLRTHANWRKVRIYQRRRAARSLAALFKEWTAWSFYQRHQRRSVARYERGAVHALLRRALTGWTAFARRRQRAKRRLAWVQQRAQRVSLGPGFYRWRKAALLDQRFQLADALTLHITVSVCFHSWQRVTREAHARRVALSRQFARLRMAHARSAFAIWRFGARAVAVRRVVCTRLVVRCGQQSRRATLRHWFHRLAAHARGVEQRRRDATHEQHKTQLRAEAAQQVGQISARLAVVKDKRLQLGHAFVERMEDELARRALRAWHGLSRAATRARRDVRRILSRWNSIHLARAMRVWVQHVLRHKMQRRTLATTVLHWQRLRVLQAFRAIEQWCVVQARRKAIVLKLLRSRQASWGQGVLKAWRSLTAAAAAAESRAASMASRLAAAGVRRHFQAWGALASVAGKARTVAKLMERNRNEWMSRRCFSGWCSAVREARTRLTVVKGFMARRSQGWLLLGMRSWKRFTLLAVKRMHRSTGEVLEKTRGERESALADLDAARGRMGAMRTKHVALARRHTQVRIQVIEDAVARRAFSAWLVYLKAEKGFKERMRFWLHKMSCVKLRAGWRKWVECNADFDLHELMRVTLRKMEFVKLRRGWHKWNLEKEVTSRNRTFGKVILAVSSDDPCIHHLSAVPRPDRPDRRTRRSHRSH